MDKLKSLRVQKGLKQYEVAKYLGVDKTTYSKYETGVSEPNFEILKKLALFFDVTSDYLIGLSQIPGNFLYDEESDNPQIKKINSLARALNDQGLERLYEYADDLVSSEKYRKGKSTRTPEAM
jgi:transcriptional regulator with XRE-family HTH domain